ncbi:AP-4-A phosphorylase [Corynebacterium occultum]|uniref:AP-4-A phosphorylase n=1 Tax=Corynebacterium occultum TaxID=2675219 RepID=A0A6B8W4T5_9CORY|nr:AP-4-A phosphorylase [Corynebacterium occultum]
MDTGEGTPDALTRLWAPYRMSYISRSPGSGDPEAVAARRRNPFVEAPKYPDEDSLIVARGRLVFAILNLYPYNSGHLMIIPYRKVSALEELTSAESLEMVEFGRLAIRTINAVSRPEGINVGFNLGKASGGSVQEHLHMHVVPRWPGDANFMTVLSGTKVLPQLLRDTRQLLAEEWRRIVADDVDYAATEAENEVAANRRAEQIGIQAAAEAAQRAAAQATARRAAADPGQAPDA